MSPAQNDELIRYINLKLVALGQPSSRGTADPHFLEIVGPLLRNYYQKDQLLGNPLCPADTRIQQFLDAYLKDVCPGGAARLPANSFVLDRPGLARVMSLAPSAQSFVSPYLHSYRAVQGVLHNPRSDRRTTEGSSILSKVACPSPRTSGRPHTGLRTVPRRGSAPAAEISSLPFTADQEEHARLFVSLLLRPWSAPPPGRSRQNHGGSLLRARQPGE